MEIICLANSFKHQGRCIAGIDRQSGRWVRPISSCDDGRIPTNNRYIPVHRIGVLDILRIPVCDINDRVGHEIENVRYANSAWEIIGKAEIANLLKYREAELLFPQYGKSIPYAYLQTQAPVRSLQLVEVKSFVCHQNSQGKWRGIIADEKYDFADMELSITDPVALEKLNRGQTISPHCLLCLSLSQPFQKEPTSPPLCYRLIAGVIELLPELEMIVQEMDRLSWSTEQGRKYLKEKYGKISRYQLTRAEARELLAFLRNIPSSHGEVEARGESGDQLAEIRKSFPNAYKS